MSGNYDEDKVRGDKGEWLFAEYLKIKKGDDILLYFNDDGKYDIKMIYDAFEILTFEIKTDYLTTNPDGNLFIEFENKQGKESGVSVSDADWYVYIFAHFNEMWFIEKDNLMKILYGMGYTFPVGESKGNNSRGYLIPRHSVDEIQKLFKKIIVDTTTLIED